MYSFFKQETRKLFFTKKWNFPSLDSQEMFNFKFLFSQCRDYKYTSSCENVLRPCRKQDVNLSVNYNCCDYLVSLPPPLLLLIGKTGNLIHYVCTSDLAFTISIFISSISDINLKQLIYIIKCKQI